MKAPRALVQDLAQGSVRAKAAPQRRGIVSACPAFVTFLCLYVGARHAVRVTARLVLCFVLGF
jgi:hypothetical protein